MLLLFIELGSIAVMKGGTCVFVMFVSRRYDRSEVPNGGADAET